MMNAPYARSPHRAGPRSRCARNGRVQVAVHLASRGGRVWYACAICLRAATHEVVQIERRWSCLAGDFCAGLPVRIDVRPHPHRQRRRHFRCVGGFGRCARWFGRCSSFACAEDPDRSCPGFLRGLQSYRLGQRTGPAGLACDCSADFIHPEIAMAIGWRSRSPHVTIFISTPAVLPTPDLPA